MSRRGSHRDKEVAQQSNGGMTEVERQARVMSAAPRGLYERFRRGLLEYHSEVSSCQLFNTGGRGARFWTA